MDKELSLEEYVSSKFGRTGFKELRMLYDEVRSGRLTLVDPNPPKDFLGYVVRLDYSLWFWVVILTSLATLASVILSEYVLLLNYLRYVLGTVYVLFMPGYVTIEALYPRDKELSNLERLALSVGLSLAIVPLLGLVLNYTPWGIRLAPTIASLTTYIIVISTTALYRKYLLNMSTLTSQLPIRIH
ncbi:MAG: DUF1616 domain-containing protein [Sulfolobales archaeon]